MFKKMASKSIALALAGIFMMTPLFNMASAMEDMIGHLKLLVVRDGELITYNSMNIKIREY